MSFQRFFMRSALLKGDEHEVLLCQKPKTTKRNKTPKVTSHDL